MEYCSDIVLPNTYYARQFERVQALVLRVYCGNFISSYDSILIKCDFPYLSSRRAAAALVNLQKYVTCSHYFLPGFIYFCFELTIRRSARRDRDIAIARNYLGDNFPILQPTISASFKKSFIFRAVSNYNRLRAVIDLDAYYFYQLRKVLSLLHYGSDGLVIS